MFLARNIYQGKYTRYLLAPLVLAIIFAALVLVSPGVTPGVDLAGGTLLIMDTQDVSLNAQEVTDYLNANFDLTDLSVSSVSSPFGNRVRIQFVNGVSLAKTQGLLEEAQDALSSDPEAARALALEIIAKNESITSLPTDYASLETAELLDLAVQAALREKEVLQEGIRASLISHFNLPENIGVQSEEVSPTLGALFWRGALMIGIVGIVFIIIVVFAFFREIVPSLAIILSVIFDALAALAAMALFNVPLSLATIPTLLLLVGYSIDTDILLTTRVLHRKEGHSRARAWDSLITGMTMTSTAITAVFVMTLLAYFMQIEVMFTIGFILFFGLLADIVGTWFMNAPLLLWYAERKYGRDQN